MFLRRSDSKMNMISIWATISVILSICGSSAAAPGSASLVKLASYHIVKKPIHAVSDEFLSFTVDPATISHVADCSLTNATLNMAKSLTPAYFRLAGVDSNNFVFQSNPNVNNSEHTSKSRVTNDKWLKLNNFLSKTGMNVIACVSGLTEHTNGDWDLSNTLELITFSDKHNISLDWQLGYELQKLASAQGKQMGRDVTRLRKILDVFPRYRKSLIIGPDMTSFKSQNDAIFVRNYLAEAGDSLDAFTWHPFSKKSEDNEILEMLSNGMNSMDNYLWIKDGLTKSTSKGVVPKKSIWIAESESTETVSNLTDSMTWIMRMGAAAKLGASVYLRKPHLLSFYEPTPEFWTAILYKSLVGRAVLDIKQTSGNDTNEVHMFTHCTKFIEKPEESIINPEISYDPGSITVYGVNMASESTRISFRIGFKGDETAHLYVLTQDNSNTDFPKTLLNKQVLGLSPKNELPLISPRIRESPKYLLVPARSIFFVVFPNTKCRSCNEFELPDASKSKTKMSEEEDLDINTFTSSVLEVMEDENDHDNVYVSYPKRTENILQMSRDPSSKSLLNSNKMVQSNSPMNVKYVTFSDETWLNTFPEKFKDVVNKENDGSFDTKDNNKAAKYRILAQAMLGKRTNLNIPKELPKPENPATRFVFEDESESNQFKRALKYPSRAKRSTESTPKDEVKSAKEEGGSEELSIDANDAIPDYNTTIGAECQSFALYLYNRQDKEDSSFENQTSFTLSKFDAMLLTDDNFEQFVNTTSLNDTVSVIAFIKKSTLEDLLKAANSSRAKREISSGHSIFAEEFANLSNLAGSSTNDFTLTKSTSNSTKIDNATNDPIDEIMDHVAKLVQLFLSMDSFSAKPLQQTNELNNMTKNKTQGNIYRILALAMLGKKTTPNVSKELDKPENPAAKFVLDKNLKTNEFQQSLKNFDRLKRSSSSTLENKFELKDELKLLVDNNNMNKSKQNIVKLEGNTKGSFLADIDSQDVALYLYNQQDSETRNFDIQKRSTPGKIYAVPLNENSLREAMKSSEFRETHPIMTFVKKNTLEGIVSAVKDEIKREITSENTRITEVSGNLTTSTTTPSSNISFNQTKDDITTQPSNTQTPLKKNKPTETLSDDIVEQVETLMKQTKNQSSHIPKLNLQQMNSSFPELVVESHGLKVARGLREVGNDPQTSNNVVGNRNLKTIDKANVRPVSPFPKKLKNGKSKSVKGTKGKSSDNIQLSRETASSTTLLPTTDVIVSTKRETQEVASSNQVKPAKSAAENPTSSDDNLEEDDMTEDSATARKFQSAITENLHEPPRTTQLNQTSIKAVSSSKLEEPVSKEMISESVIPSNESDQHMSSGNKNSDTVGKPHIKLSLAEMAKKNRVKSMRTHAPLAKKPKMTPEQLRLSYKRSRKELLQKHLTRLNELRSILGMPSLPQSHLIKREANIFANILEDTKSLTSQWWENLRNWDPKQLWTATQTEESKDAATGRSKRQVNQDTTEQHSPPLFEIFGENRPKRSEKIEVSPWTNRFKYGKRDKEAVIARIEERKRMFNIEKSMRSQTEAGYVRLRRDLQKTIETFQELKEKKQTRANELRQKMSKHIEEMKQKRPHHAPSLTHHNKHNRDSQDIRRNKRDVQTIQDKINETRKKMQEHRQEIRKKFENEHPAPQTVPKPKAKSAKIDEPHHQAVDPIKTDEHSAPQALPKPKAKLAKIDVPRHSAANPPSRTNDPRHQGVNPPTKIDEPRHQTVNPPTKIEESHHQAVNPTIKTDETLHQADNPAKSDEFHHHPADKTSKKIYKPVPIKEKSHRLHKRELNENQLEEKVTSPSDLQKQLKFRLLVDPELNTPQSRLEDSNLDDLDLLKRSLNNNEIFDEDDEAGSKIKNKDHEDYNFSKFNKVNDSVKAKEPSTSTYNPLTDTQNGNLKIEIIAPENSESSQQNQTCQLTNYNVFKYLWCLANEAVRSRLLPTLRRL